MIPGFAERAWKGQGVFTDAPFLLFLILTAAPLESQTDRFRDGFQQGHFDPQRWTTTSEGDFRERTVDVIEVAPGDYRLRLRADTRETRPDTVKFVGARTVDKIRLSPGTAVAAEIDWNDQTNGSYLSAALILSSEETSGNPLLGSDWLKVEYVGVPPGRNARMVVAVRVDDGERILFTEGWPEANRSGRRISRQKLRIELLSKGVHVWENDKILYASPEPLVSFDAAYIYLQMSSHSNYPPREVYFDEIEVTER